MKIVIATPILYEPSSPFNHLFKDIIEGFLEAGHEVVRIVACEDMNDARYKLGIDNSAISYIPVLRKKAGHSKMIQRYLSDTLTSIKMSRVIKKVKADILFEDVCYSSYWTVKAAKKNRMKVVAMLQDIWPDNAVQSRIIHQNSVFYKYFEFWQRAVYRNANKIICISDDMKLLIESKGIPNNKINVIYNWGYSDEIVDIPWEENRFVKKYNLSKDFFYAIYAGNIGRMQNVELILKAAERLKNRDRIKFLIIGDGVRKDAIEQIAIKKKLTNILFLPLQAPELATSIYSAAGVNLIPLVPGGVKTALPSKIGVCLSCGRPIIFAFGKECRFAELVKKYTVGDCVSAEDEMELVEAICNHVNEIKHEKNYDLFQERFNKEINVKSYIEALYI